MNAVGFKTSRIQKGLLVALVVLLAFAIVPGLSVYAGTATLSIPSVSIEASIVDIYIKAFPDGAITWDTTALGNNIGHLDQTPWFGSGSNVVLGGHSEDTNRRPSIFANLGKVQIGEIITVLVDGNEFHYAVSEIKQVDKDDLSILYPSAGERLTLFTCDTATYDAATNNYPYRLVVIAERVG